MFIGILNISAAIILSLISAYFSITGITTIFSGAAAGVALMGAALEFSKIAATIWLHSWWKKANKLLKVYLVFAVVILIGISSIGIYGYLAKAYVGQEAPAIQYQSDIQRIDLQIDRYEREIERAQLNLDTLDEAIDIYLEYDNATRGLQQLDNQQEDRDALYEQIDTARNEIDDLLDQKFEIQNQINTLETDVGPIKYLAAILYGEDNAESNYDNAARLLIILLVLVFDPFAVLMMVSGSIALENREKKTKLSRAQKQALAKAREAKAKKASQEQNVAPVRQMPKIENVAKENKKVHLDIDMGEYVDPEEIKEIKKKTEHPQPRRKP